MKDREDGGSLSVVIPVFNEESSLTSVVRSVTALPRCGKSSS
jgi:hypothetical protein